MKYYWLSFGTSQGNLGVVITQAENTQTAYQKVTGMGNNPGGEVGIFECPKDEATNFPLDTLITPKELRKKGYQSTVDRGESRAKTLSLMSDRICPDCNKAIIEKSL